MLVTKQMGHHDDWEVVGNSRRPKRGSICHSKIASSKEPLSSFSGLLYHQRCISSGFTLAASTLLFTLVVKPLTEPKLLPLLISDADVSLLPSAEIRSMQDLKCIKVPKSGIIIPKRFVYSLFIQVNCLMIEMFAFVLFSCLLLSEIDFKCLKVKCFKKRWKLHKKKRHFEMNAHEWMFFFLS